MKWQYLLSVFLFFGVITGICPAEESNEDLGLLTGSTPVVQYSEIGTIRCFTYSHWVVASQDSEDDAGADIFVKALKGGEKISCDQVIANSDFKIENTMGNYFHGIFGTNLFVDCGTGPDGRILMVYDMQTGQEKVRTEYSDDGAVVDAKGILTIWVPSDTRADKNNCSSYEEYMADGLGAAIEDEAKLNTRQFSLTKTGAQRCAPRQ